MLALYSLARGLAGQVDLPDSGDIISKHLRRIVPASTCVFFVYEADKDELVSGYASGDSAALFSGLRIARGERLSGWVAANLQTIVNSDPVLDLGEASRGLRGRLRSCLSTPLSNRGQLVGVLSVYSPEVAAFTDDHRRIIEVVARQVSRVVAFAKDAERPRDLKLVDDATGLPLSGRLESFVTAELEVSEASEPLSIMLLQIRPAASHPDGPGNVSDLVLSAIITAVKKALRGGDILSRHGEREFVALLTQTDSKGGELVCFRVLERLRDSDFAKGSEALIGLGIAPATAPADGTTLEALMNAARGRLRAVTLRRKDQPSVH
jgi:GGDEF domain-containing protein